MLNYLQHIVCVFCTYTRYSIGTGMAHVGGVRIYVHTMTERGIFSLLTTLLIKWFTLVLCLIVDITRVMKIYKTKNKYVVLDDRGFILIMTRYKNICLRLMSVT